jgi:hypothetical protein
MNTLKLMHLGKNPFEKSIPYLKQFIANTAKHQDEWDDCPNGLTLKTLKHAVAIHNKWQWLVVVSQVDGWESTYQSKMIHLKYLQHFWDAIANKLKKAHLALAKQQTQLNEMWKGKVRQQMSMKPKVFTVLKDIG